MPENIWLLLAKKLTKEASSAELQELDAWFSEHPDVKGMAEELSHFWNTGLPATHDSKRLFLNHLGRLKAADPSFGLSPEHFEEAVKVISVPNYFKRNYRIILSVAAILVVLFCSALWVVNPNFFEVSDVTKGNNSIINEVETKPGSRSKVVLPDGSEVWVNAQSRLLYKPDFGKSHRKVILNGEAYFKVAKNKDLPFEIEAKRMTITVTGTTFNVRAYDDEEKAETSLFEGSVHVTPHKLPGRNYVLRPNQKLIIDESEAGYEPSPANTSTPAAPIDMDKAEAPVITTIAHDPRDSMVPETSWLYSTLAFNDESFLELSCKMEKWYGIKIIFESEKLKKLRFTGRFTTESIQEALEALQFTTRFKFRKEENKVIIY